MRAVNDQPTSLAGKLIVFTRGFRKAGIPIGNQQQSDALAAVARVGLQRRDDVRAALRTVLIRHPRYLRLFERAFDLFFLANAPSTTPAAAAEPGEPSLLPVPRASLRGRDDAPASTTTGARRRIAASENERLRHKDFAAMTDAEQRAAAQLLRNEILLPEPLPVRRYAASNRGRQIDPRRSLRGILQNGGEISLARRQRISRRPNLVLLCDISASMSAYTRAFLLYAQALASRYQRVHGFVFATRLSNVSAELRAASSDRALALISARAKDWDGGTRIAANLRRFNHDWGRRVLGNNASVVLLSDGLERDAGGASLAFELQRLRQSCRQLLWLNPLLRYDGFRAVAGGMPQLLEQADALLPAHNLISLVTLSERLKADTTARQRRTAA